MTKQTVRQLVTRGMLLLTVFSLTSSLAGQYRMGSGGLAGWQHLGNAHVDGRADHDRIEVGGGTFRATVGSYWWRYWLRENGRSLPQRW